MNDKQKISNSGSQNQRRSSIVEVLSIPPNSISSSSTFSTSISSASELRHPLQGQSKQRKISRQISNEQSLSRQCSVSSLESNVSTTRCLNKLHSQWQHIKLSELVEENKLVVLDANISVEDAFNKLVEHNLTSVPVERFPGDMDCMTFDYNDLNSYLLLVLGKISIKDEEVTRKCQSGQPVPVGPIVCSTPKNPFYKVPETENLLTVMGILGSGVHRVAITDPQATQIRGILSQRRLMSYLWENAYRFGDLDAFLDSSLLELGIGVLDSQTPPTSIQSRVISVLEHEYLVMALYKMHQERISSIAVIDNQGMLLGNISVTDVKNVTRTSQYPLLHNTCRHFISVILNAKGLEMGKDSFPIFYVYPTSSLTRTIAKLVATKAHRLWIVQPVEPVPIPTSSSEQLDFSSRNITLSPGNSPSLTTQVSSLDKDYGTGYLVGVVSLTDILGLLARKHMENKQVDPLTARRQRCSVVG